MRKIDFVSLQVRDLEASKDFYTSKLGFEVGSSNPQAYIFQYNKGESSFAIRTPLADIEGKELGTGVSLWFAVDESAEALKDRLTENGVTNVSPILDTPFGRSIHITDPDGYKLTFFSV